MTKCTSKCVHNQITMLENSIITRLAALFIVTSLVYLRFMAHSLDILVIRGVCFLWLLNFLVLLERDDNIH